MSPACRRTGAQSFDPGAGRFHLHITAVASRSATRRCGCSPATARSWGRCCPSEPEYWPPVNRELTLTLDDILLEHGRVAPFSRSGATYVAMGRFGNFFLVNGKSEFWQGEVVRSCQLPQRTVD